jgi:FkbM family methyltransferase
MLMKKLWVNLLCCFVPGKENRKEIKRKLFGTENRLRKLLAYGCQIENEIITTPEGVKIDISNVPHEAMGIAKEIFLNKDYALHFSRDVVLIDIGFNRGIASLFFATYPNVVKIYAYEPFKPTFELAKRNLELNPRLSEKINAFNFGLGRTDATLELPYMGEATGGMSTTHDVCMGKNNGRMETVVVKDAAGQIAPILEEHRNKHILVKCDCEGAEFEIFERLNEEGLIGKIDMILMEYHYHSPGSLIDILTSHRFVVRTRVLSEETNKGYIYAVRMAGK